MTREVLSEGEKWRVLHGDCLEVMRGMPDGCVSALVTDPPYFRVKNEAWDRQWDDSSQFLHWIGQLCDEWQRILIPSGSLYCFASPQMAWGVEGEIRRRFTVLNRITWAKTSGAESNKTGRWSMADKEVLRAYFPASETCVFAEKKGSDSMALGESGYAAQCESLRGFVFEPLRAYLAGEFQKAGWKANDLNHICGTASMAGHHYTARSQWCLPTEEHYHKLQAAATHKTLCREYEDLRREYEDLRREYEDLRRPFNVSAEVPHTDVWTYRTVPSGADKHVCQKPLSMMVHILEASTRPDDLVLDCFLGSGTTGHAAAVTGRRFIGIEQDIKWVKNSEKRIAAAYAQGKLNFDE